MTKIFRLALITGSLALAASCGGSGYSSTPTTPSAPSSGNNGTPISIVSGASRLTTTAYSPNPLTITAGTMVTWTNNDAITHTAVSDSGLFNGTLAAGQQFSFTFQNKGTFTYHCSIHPGMVASVVVQ